MYRNIYSKCDLKANQNRTIYKKKKKERSEKEKK